MPTTRLVTAEEFLAMGEGCRELIAGRVVEVTPATNRASRVGVKIAAHLIEHAGKTGLGEVFGADGGFRLAVDPDFVRVPDASFVAAARAAGLDPEAFIPFAPDLAVEVVSPSDSFKDVEEKARMWLGHGSRLVWVVEPALRLVFVYRPDGTRATLSEGDTISGDDVLPGLALPVSACF